MFAVLITSPSPSLSQSLIYSWVLFYLMLSSPSPSLSPLLFTFTYGVVCSATIDSCCHFCHYCHLCLPLYLYLYLYVSVPLLLACSIKIYSSAPLCFWAAGVFFFSVIIPFMFCPLCCRCGTSTNTTALLIFISCCSFAITVRYKIMYLDNYCTGMYYNFIVWLTKKKDFVMRDTPTDKSNNLVSRQK